MNDPGPPQREKTQEPYLSTESFERCCGDVTLGRHVPPLIHIPTGVHARSVGLVKHQIAQCNAVQPRKRCR
jgi:hypothetical protein